MSSVVARKSKCPSPSFAFDPDRHSFHHCGFRLQALSSILHPAGWHWTHRVSKQIVMYTAMGGGFLAYKTTPPTGSTLLEGVGIVPHRTIPGGLAEMEPQEVMR